MNRYTSLLLLSSALLVSMTACQATKEQLGMTRHTPDEFTVMERAPLAIPADLNQLPPPNPGAPRPQDASVATLAKNAVLGNKADGTTTTATSSAESSLLAKTGANKVPTGIRATVNKETAEAPDDNRAVVKKILGLGNGEPAATVVDAKKEATRIQKQKATGQTVTGADTPTVNQ